MPTNSLSTSNLDIDDVFAVKLFWLVASLHCLVWILLPCLTQNNAPLDTIEMLYWGHEWQWGYYKHPPMPAWMAEASVMPFGNVIWPTYVMAQVCTLACFWSAFTVAKNCVGPRAALLSVLSLESCYYFHYTTPEFNNNVVSRAFWALTIAFLYFGVVHGQLWGWAIAGITLGLGMLSKYDTCILAMTMLLFSMISPLGRSAWRTWGPFLTFAGSIVIFAPHVIWMMRNNFPTVNYFTDRSSKEINWYDYVLYPIGFLAEQSLAFVPILLFASLLIGKKWKLRVAEGTTASNNREFILVFVLLPVVLVMMSSLITGVRIQSMWGAALWTYLGVLVVVCFQVPTERANLRLALQWAVGLCFLAGIAHLVHDVGLPMLNGRQSRSHFPGRELAGKVEQAFQRETGTSPAAIGGEWWPAANAAFYMKRRSSVYPDLNPKICPWFTDAKFSEVGGAIVYPSDWVEDDTTKNLTKRFPTLIEVGTVEVRSKNVGNPPPLSFQVYVVPPEKR